MATAEASLETYLTPADIGRHTKNSPSAPIRWIQKGALLNDRSRLRLQAVRTPGGWRIRRDWLDDFLEAIADDRRRPDTPSVVATQYAGGAAQ
jgi:hypothetical protein